METMNLEKRRGRPPKQPEIEEQTLQKVDQSQKEEDKVEIGYSHDKLLASMRPNEYLANKVVPKYPKMYVAWVDKEHVRQAWRGWKPIRWDQARDELVQVESLDEADKTTGNVLAWRDIRIQQAIWDEEKKAREESNKLARRTSSETQAKEVDMQFRELSGGRITAKALRENENE